MLEAEKGEADEFRSMNPSIFSLIFVLVLASASQLAFSQAPLRISLPPVATQNDGSLPAYDVSVIRTAVAGASDRHVWTRLNTLDVKNMPLFNLLKSAFDVSDDRMIGLPEWARHTQVDIEAKTLETDRALLLNLTQEQRRAMMLALFQDRLGLKWHNEIRVLPSYDLLVANGGPKLKLTEATNRTTGVSVNDTRFKLTNVPISELAVVLSDKLERSVVDQTGLTGRYDVTLAWSDDSAVTSANPDALPPLLTVLQEQIGLKVRSGKEPIQVVIIDQINAPTAN